MSQPLKATCTVVNDHNRALIPILTSMNQRSLPRSGLKLLNFDSHPDLRCPEGPVDPFLTINQPECPTARVLKATDVASWIIPLVFAGCLDEVTWVSGWWCDQITQGTYELMVGVDESNNRRIKVAGRYEDDEKYTGCCDYWMSDNCWLTSSSQLSRSRPWTLHVLRADDECRMDRAQLQHISSVFNSTQNGWILSYDEDFISTQNPATELLSKYLDVNEVEAVKRFYCPGSDDDIVGYWECCKEYIYGSNTNINEIRAKLINTMDGENTAAVITTIDGILKRRKLSANRLHEFGTGVGLPEHVSSDEEMERMINISKKILSSIGCAPLISVIARSLKGPYVPHHQACIIHKMVMKVCGSETTNENTITKNLPTSPPLTQHKRRKPSTTPLAVRNDNKINISANQSSISVQKMLNFGQSKITNNRTRKQMAT